jgi:tetratricopeptide (TPR) repeat protein
MRPPRRGVPANTWSSLAGWALAAAVSLVYANSLSGAFVFDDFPDIVENPLIRSLWPPWHVLAMARPVVNLSLAVNYALGGLKVAGYHLVNVAAHGSAALLLFGVIRRTLELAPRRTRSSRLAPMLAFLSALLWAIHPVQTQSVTYLIQRAEVLAGCGSLLALYAAIRSLRDAHPERWEAVAIAACALAMGSKPSAAAAPLLVLLYDRTFVSGSVAEALRRRRRLYAGLAATWLLLVPLLLAEHRLQQISTERLFLAATPMRYLLTQPGVILHYLSLALWPKTLIFDYLWPVAPLSIDALRPLVPVVALGWLIARAWRRRSPSGFLGAWWFVTLLPTSSLIPIPDAAAEHRLYLPLAAVAVGTVIGYDRWAMGAFRRLATLRRACAVALAALVITGLGSATIRRNQDYHSEVGLWTDVIAKRPENPRAHNGLGRALVRTKEIQEAIPAFTRAVELRPDYADARYNLGLALASRQVFDEAIAQLAEAVRLSPGDAEARQALQRVQEARQRR